MALKFTKSDDLDKMFEEFAILPDLDSVTFPDKTKETDDKKEQQS